MQIKWLLRGIKKSHTSSGKKWRLDLEDQTVRDVVAADGDMDDDH